MGSLFAVLDSCAGAGDTDSTQSDEESFRLDHYRETIRHSLAGATRRFSSLPTLHDDARMDRARRFVTLIYMEHDREVVLEQKHEDILVIPLGAYNEG